MPQILRPGDFPGAMKVEESLYSVEALQERVNETLRAQVGERFDTGRYRVEAEGFQQHVVEIVAEECRTAGWRVTIETTRTLNGYLLIIKRP